MTTDYDDTDFEPAHTSSPTDHVLTELQLYGHRPFQDEPDPRALPEAAAVTGAVAEIFDAFVTTLGDTRLEPDLEDLLWSTVNIFHRAVGRIERELDDNEQAQRRSQREQDGSEIRSVDLERLTAEGISLIERRNSMEFFRDQAAEQFERHTRSAWRPRAGSIVETRSYEDAAGRKRLSLATRSDLTIEAQVSAPGATWLDRQLLSKDSTLSGGGFGAEVGAAMDRRIDHLAGQGLAQRQGQRIVFARDLINTLRRRELNDAATRLSVETGLPHRPSNDGEHVSGVYRQRVTLASGRFAMIDDGIGFQLVPWRPALEQQLGKHVSGRLTTGGGVDWSSGRKRGLGL